MMEDLNRLTINHLRYMISLNALNIMEKWDVVMQIMMYPKLPRMFRLMVYLAVKVEVVIFVQST